MENITEIFFIFSKWEKCCSIIVYPYERIPQKIAQSFPAKWKIAGSDRE